MEMRIDRVVTQNTPDGKASFASIGPAPNVVNFVHTPGFATTTLWATEATTLVPGDGTDNSLRVTSSLPGPGASRFVILQLPPDTVYRDPQFDGAAARREQLEKNAGLAETIEEDHPGMHTTDTVDYGIVLEGEVWLELDDGVETCIKRHGAIVQTGTRHAWRNKSASPAIIAFVLLGVRRKPK
jgi:hypothetical protein